MVENIYVDTQDTIDTEERNSSSNATPWQEVDHHEMMAQHAVSDTHVEQEQHDSDAAGSIDVSAVLEEEMDKLFENFGQQPLERATGSPDRRTTTTSSVSKGMMALWRKTPDVTNDSWKPTMAVSYEGDTFVVCADLPGIRKEQLHCRITSDNMLILSGERPLYSANANGMDDARGDEVNGQSVKEAGEACYSTFRRTMRLPDNLDTQKVNAKFEIDVDLEA